MPVIPIRARQASPRPESIPRGHMENQLTGRPPLHVPQIQGYPGFEVTEIPEDGPRPRPRPVPAPFAQGPEPYMLVEEVMEIDAGVGDESRGTEPRATKRARGERHGRAKLSAAEVRQIRLLAEGGGWTVTAMARAFNVSRAAVRKVIKKTTWNDDMWLTGECDE